MYKRTLFIKIFPYLLSIIAVMITVFTLEFILSKTYSKEIELNWQTNSTSGNDSTFRLDSDLIYSLKPNAHSYWETDEFIESVSINSIGLRNQEIDQNDKFNVLVLGDSFTFGHGVSLEASYPKRLEKLIKDAGLKNVQVINAGIKGYNLEQEYRFFTERLSSIKPKLLIITLGRGDYDWSDYPLYAVKNNQLEKLKATRTWLYIQAYLYNIAPDWLRKSFLFRYFLISLAGKNYYNLNPFSTDKITTPKSNDEFISMSLLLLNNLKEKCEENGCHILVVIAPFDTMGEFNEKSEFNSKYGSLSQFKVLLKNNRIDFVDSNQIEYIDEKNEELVPEQLDFKWNQFSFKNDTHLTEEGNLLFALIVKKYLIENYLLPLNSIEKK